MKKLFLALLSLSLVFTLVGCSSNTEETTTTTTEETTTETEETTEEADVTIAPKYVITNNTGATVTELYFTENATGTKTDNLVGENGLADGESITVDASVNDMFAEWTGKEADSHSIYTLNAVCDDGLTIEFATLSREDVSISLIAEDARTGATQIAFTY